jgi:K+-transporting ATPase ATPase C chain
MLTTLRPAVVLFVLFSVLTGLAYPAAVTGLAAGLFAAKAGGSLIVHDGKVVGSSLIGQPFSGPGYFWGRLSATGPMPYNAAASSGSNLGPTNPALIEAATGRIKALRAADSAPDPVPVDLVTASGSGLDPQISPAAAYYQVPRIAKARGLAPERVRALVDAGIEQPQLGFLGETRINVLALNLALDELK